MFMLQVNVMKEAEISDTNSIGLNVRQTWNDAESLSV